MNREPVGDRPRFRRFDHPPLPGLRISKELDEKIGEWYFWWRKRLSDALIAQGLTEKRRD